MNAGTGDDKTIPITEIQDFTKETHSYLSSNADKIASTVNSVIGDFVKGGKDNITNGVSSLITEAVTVLFGETESSDITISKYYIAMEGVALIRLDLMGWKRSVEATSLRKKVEQVSAFTLSKSTVDVTKLDFDTFLDQYQDIVKADNPKISTTEIVTSAKDLFKLFKEESESDKSKKS